jgi:glycosyltransferase involved in cell wall biosynthesis
MPVVASAIKLPLIRLRANGIRLLKPLDRGTGKARLIILDPGLVAFAGHHFEWNSFIRRELRAHFDVSLYANIRVRRRVIGLLDARPIFEDGTYPKYGERDFRAVHNAMTRGIVDSLRKIHQSHLSANSVALMHTLTVFQLTGIAEWYLGLSIPQRPKLLLHFQFPLEFLVHPASAQPQAVELARRAVGALSDAGPVRFTCNSESLAEELRERLGIHCALLPLPINWPDALDRMQPPPSGAVFGFFGGLRPEKGAHLLARAIPSIVAQFPDTRFIVHAPISECDESAVQAMEGLPRVELLRRSLVTKDAYFAHFCRAACILLPYEPNAYRRRTSSVLIEALGTRRLVVTTKGTWMEAQVRKHGAKGVLMDEFTVEDLIRCLSEARLRLVSGAAPNEGIDSRIASANSPAAFCTSIVAALQ